MSHEFRERIQLGSLLPCMFPVRRETQAPSDRLDLVKQVHLDRLEPQQQTVQRVQLDEPVQPVQSELTRVPQAELDQPVGREHVEQREQQEPPQKRGERVMREPSAVLVRWDRRETRVQAVRQADRV